jgi:hypothetical protein
MPNLWIGITIRAPQVESEGCSSIQPRREGCTDTVVISLDIWITSFGLLYQALSIYWNGWQEKGVGRKIG